MLRALVWTPHCCARGDQMPSLRAAAWPPRVAAHTRGTPLTTYEPTRGMKILNEEA